MSETVGDFVVKRLIQWGIQRVYGYPGLHIVDGATITANLGVNPSLTITAQAERAMSYWPNRGDTDPRPRLGDPYSCVEPIAPQRPFVPEHAPAALRLSGTVKIGSFGMGWLIRTILFGTGGRRGHAGPESRRINRRLSCLTQPATLR